jgi:hypothetical protein
VERAEVERGERRRRKRGRGREQVYDILVGGVSRHNEPCGLLVAKIAI